jgi:predicted RNA-binding Zn ribbon-like protein
MDNPKRQEEFLFLGNHPSLDFINTELLIKGTLTDLLDSFEDLEAWLIKSRTLRKDDVEAANRELSPRQKAMILAQAKAFRSTLRKMVQHIANGEGVPKSAVTAINQLLRPCAGYRQVVLTGLNAFKEVFVSSSGRKDVFLASLAMFASELLCSGDLALIKKCKNPACVLYFYDTTKNHARNWCSMQLCGNREKVATYFRRKRQDRTRYSSPSSATS